MECIRFICCFFSLMMHAILSSMCHQVDFLEAVAFRRGSGSFPRAVLQALKNVNHFTSTLDQIIQDYPVSRETILSWRDVGKYGPF